MDKLLVNVETSQTLAGPSFQSQDHENTGQKKPPWWAVGWRGW